MRSHAILDVYLTSHAKTQRLADDYHSQPSVERLAAWRQANAADLPLYQAALADGWTPEEIYHAIETRLSISTERTRP